MNVRVITPLQVFLKGATMIFGFVIALSSFGQSIQSVTLNPATVAGGSATTGTITLSANAPTGGLSVSLTSQIPDYVGVPSSVTVPAGSISVEFTVTTKPFRQTYSDLITAKDSSTNRNVTLTVTGDSIAAVAFSPSSVQGGSTSLGTVSLLIPAPAGGWRVNLVSQIPSYVGVPASLMIPEGSASGSFSISTKPFRQTYTNLITAQDSLSSKSGTLTVLDDSVTGVTFSPMSVAGGSSSTGTVTLLSPAPSEGWTVNLVSQIPTYVGVPPSISIPSGQSSGTFTVTTKPFRESYSNEITATDATSSRTGSLSVSDDSIASVSLNPSTILGGNSSTGTVTLYATAPSGGWTVSLASQIPSYVGVSGSVTIPAGSTSGTFQISSKPFRQNFTSLITLTDATSTKSVTLTVLGDSVTGVTLTPTTVIGGVSCLATVSLLSPAPVPWQVNLLSQIPAYVGVPSSVIIPAGSLSASFTVTTKPFRQLYTNSIKASDSVSSAEATLEVRMLGLANSPWPMFRGDMEGVGRGIGSGATGVLSWQYPTFSATSSSPAIGSDGTVFIGSTDDNVYAFNPSNGSSLKWIFQNTAGQIESSPSVGSDGTVYIGCFDNNLYAIAGSTGVENWQFTTGGPIGHSSPAIGADGTVYIGSWDGSMYAVDGQLGTEKWSFPTNGLIDSTATIGVNGNLYFGSDDGFVYAVNGQTGSLVWAYQTGGPVESSPAIGSDGTIYIGSSDDFIYAIDGVSGTLKWKTLTGGAVESSPAIAADGTLVVGSGDSKLYALNFLSGSVKWTFATGDPIGSSPSIALDGTIYLGAEDGNLYAINGQTGLLQWHFSNPAGSIFESSCAIGADGSLYLGDQDGTVYAIH